MNSSQVIALLNDLESRYPVTEWKIDGVRIWPVLRARIYTTIIFYYLSSERPLSVSRVARLRRLFIIPENMGKVAVASLRDWRHARMIFRPADILVLGDGTGFTKLEDAWYDRVMDPLIERFSAAGQSSFLMSQGWYAYQPRRTPSLFVQPQIELRKVWATLWCKMKGPPASARLEGIDAMVAELRGREYGVDIPDRRWLIQQWARISAVSQYFSNALQRVKPKAALVSTYYSAEGLAFCLACRRAGVPVADVQHGDQGWGHMAYASWNAIPAGGYELLPHRFWVWSETEGTPIAAWSRATGQKPVVIGNAWARIWSSGNYRFVAKILDKAIALRNDSGAVHHILLALSTGYSDEALALLFRAASRFPAGEFFWWIRLHPAQLGMLKRYAALARGNGLENFNIVDATVLPLQAVMHAIDLHLSPGSTTVTEAQMAGVRSIVTNAYGLDICRDAIAAGVAVAALSEDDIAAAIPIELAKGALPNDAQTKDEMITAALDDLLKLQ